MLKFRAGAFTGGHKMSHHNGMLKEGVDVAVCTPGRLRQLLEGSLLSLDLCQVRLLAHLDTRTACTYMLLPRCTCMKPVALWAGSRVFSVQGNVVFMASVAFTIL